METHHLELHNLRSQAALPNGNARPETPTPDHSLPAAPLPTSIATSSAGNSSSQLSVPKPKKCHSSSVHKALQMVARSCWRNFKRCFPHRHHRLPCNYRWLQDGRLAFRLGDQATDHHLYTGHCVPHQLGLLHRGRPRPAQMGLLRAERTPACRLRPFR